MKSSLDGELVEGRRDGEVIGPVTDSEPSDQVESEVSARTADISLVPNLFKNPAELNPKDQVDSDISVRRTDFTLTTSVWKSRPEDQNSSLTAIQNDPGPFHEICLKTVSERPFRGPPTHEG